MKGRVRLQLGSRLSADRAGEVGAVSRRARNSEGRFFSGSAGAAAAGDAGQCGSEGRIGL